MKAAIATYEDADVLNLDSDQPRPKASQRMCTIQYLAAVHNCADHHHTRRLEAHHAISSTI